MTLPLVPALLALRRAAVLGEPLVVGQLGQSLDGRIATPTGHSHYINGSNGIELLHTLRAEVDAVVVGAGTAVADDPQLTVRLVEGVNPARVLIDRQRRAGAALKLLAEDGAPRIVFGPALPDDPPGLHYVKPPAAAIDPGFIVAALNAAGLQRILIEGGASTVSRFLDGQALDRLCVVVAPMVIGSGPVGIDLDPIETLVEARRPLTHVVQMPDGDVLFDCDLRAAASA